MFFKYLNIDFNYNENEISEEEIKNFIKPIIELAKNVDIYEINIEDRETIYIYINKTGPKEAWDEESLNFGYILQNHEFEVMFADEDYGDCFNVLIIYND